MTTNRSWHEQQVKKTRLGQNGKRKRADWILAPAWADWLIENYVEGVASEDLILPLIQAGVTRVAAEKALEELRGNALVASMRRKVLAHDQLKELVQLRNELGKVAPFQVERRRNVSGEEFFEAYYALGRPVILTDVAEDWPALKLWSPEYFAEKFGDAELSVCMGREGDPHCDRNFEKYLKKTTMREYANWVAQAGRTNDGYLISNNRMLENEIFHTLLADIIAPEAYVDPSRFFTYMSFWFGPEGTFTPLHHDGNNILFCQVVGKKEFYLVSPWETELLSQAQGYYAHRSVPLDMEGEGYRAPDEKFPWPAVRVVLNPGEALFLPVGFWHQVRSLDLSVSLSFLNFRAENHFHWYAPGKLNES